jgi:hypothetical protein
MEGRLHKIFVRMLCEVLNLWNKLDIEGISRNLVVGNAIFMYKLSKITKTYQRLLIPRIGLEICTCRIQISSITAEIT